MGAIKLEFFLAMIIDVFIRKVVGWAIMEMETKALTERSAPDFHHSYRGKQYCAKKYTDILA